MTYRIHGTCDNCGGPVMVAEQVLCYFCRHERKAKELSPKPHRDPNCEADEYADDCDCRAPVKERE